jgi:hypothetical protein
MSGGLTGIRPIVGISQRSCVPRPRSRSCFRNRSAPSTSRWIGCSASKPLLERGPAWRLYPVVQALQTLRGVQWLVAITVVAELGDLTRFDSPRQLAAVVGLTPSEDSTGPRRRLGAITKTGNGRARRALIEGAWAYRHPAKVSEHLQRRIGALPKPIQDIGWKAQVRLCKRFRRLVARGKHPNVAVTAIARELIAFMWVIASEVSITTSALTRMFHRKKRALRCDRLRLVLRPC